MGDSYEGMEGAEIGKCVRLAADQVCWREMTTNLPVVAATSR